VFDIDLESVVAEQDPDLTKQIKNNRPAVAPPTGVPNRHTTFVPSENTTFSLGEKCKDRINDVGITGRTDNHVHFEVTAKNKTLVSLGGSATDTVIESFDADHVPKKSVGYSMVTDEHAWHDAKKHQYSIAREGDTAVVAAAAHRRAMLQATSGLVEINAKEGISASSTGLYICADPGLTYKDPKYDKDLEGATGKSTVAKWARLASGAVDVIQSGLTLVRSFKKTFKKGEDKKAGWKEDAAHAFEMGKWIYDAVKMEQAIVKLKKLYDDDPSKPASSGCVKIAATEDIGMLAGHNASLYGMKSVGISSLMSASVSATHKATIKGVYQVGVSGHKVSVKGTKQVKINADSGNVEITAKKDASTDAEGSVRLTSKKFAQLNTDGRVFVQGLESAFIGAGEGSGYAFLVDVNGMYLGKFSNPKNMPDSKPIKDEGIFQNKDTIMTRLKDSRIEANKKDIRLKSPKIKLNGDEVTVKGKVLLG
jgi:hypothetical protein